MVDISTLEYKVVAFDEGGKKHDITDFIENFGWEENDHELAVRLSFTARNDIVSKSRLSSTIKPNCLILAYAKSGKKPFEEVVRGKVVTWSRVNKNSGYTFKCTAYDDLYCLQKSQDDFFFQSGISTKSRISKVLGQWGISLGKYEGPNASHGKKKYQAMYISDIVLAILDDGVKKGGSKCIIRQEKGQVQIVKRGGNKDVYVFETDNTTALTHSLSTEDMVTRVKIMGKEKKGGKEKVIATLNGDTKYGIRQRIYKRGHDEKLSDAKSAAQAILDENGRLKNEAKVQSPDVPYIRKGDLVCMRAQQIKGDFYVLSIQHDAETRSMTMDIKRKK